MEYIKIQEAAKKWNMSVRRTQDLCRMGRVLGARRFGTNWMIPADAPRPADGRRKEVKETGTAPRQPLRKSLLLSMTDLYHTPGKADECIEAAASHPKTQALFKAEIAYSRGEIDKVFEYAQCSLNDHADFYTVISSGMLLSVCAVWKGDLRMWQQAKNLILDAPCKSETDKKVLTLSLAMNDSALRAAANFPEWFTRGCFDVLPTDSLPAARTYYIAHLLVWAQELALGKIKLDGVYGIGLLKILPYVAEPMIAQAITDKTVLAEIYLRLLCAISYHQCGDLKRATVHLDKAIALALPDRLYGPLVEHRRQLGILLDDRLMIADPKAAKRVKELHNEFHIGWTKLHNAVLERTVSIALSAREREVARLVAFGFSDAQIAKQLFISEASVKSLVRAAKNKTGVEKRSDLAYFI